MLDEKAMISKLKSFILNKSPLMDFYLHILGD